MKSKNKEVPFELDEFYDYYDTLDDDAKKWVKKFYKEYYKDGFYGKEKNIITDSEMKKEARRNHNSRKSDVLHVAAREGKLSQYTQPEDIPDNDTDETAIDNLFDNIGYNKAVDVVMNEALKLLDEAHISRRLTLIKFHSNMSKLNVLRKERGIRKGRKK